MQKNSVFLPVWRSATILDELWDRGLLDNPQFHIAVAPVIDGIMLVLFNVPCISFYRHIVYC